MSHPMEIMHENHYIILDWKGQIVACAKKSPVFKAATCQSCRQGALVEHYCV